MWFADFIREVAYTGLLLVALLAIVLVGLVAYDIFYLHRGL